MATGTEILESKAWKEASPEERQVIFARKVAKNPAYANADPETQQKIQQRFGIGEAAPEPVSGQSAEAPAEAEQPTFAPIEAMPAHIESLQEGPSKPRVSSETMAGAGAGLGAAKGLLERYMLSPDKLQRDLYARSIRNVLQEAGVNVMGATDEKSIIDLARSIMPNMIEGQRAQLGSMQQRADSLRAAIPSQPSMSTGFPSQLEQAAGRASGPGVAGESAASNWMRAMAGPEHQLPEQILQSAQDMTKTNPRGGQALINKDLANLERIKGVGAGDYQLAGQGRGQLMVPPAEAERMAAQEASRVAQQSQIAQEALGILQPQIASVEAEVARLTRLGKDASQFTARLEQLRRMEQVARKTLGRGLNVPAQAELSPLARLGYKLGAPGIPMVGPVLGNALAGAGAGFDISEAFDRASGKDPLGAAVHGVSAVMNAMSMVPPVNPPMAAVKGVGTLGALGMLPVKMMLPGIPSVMDRNK